MMKRCTTLLAVMMTGTTLLFPGSGASAQEAGEDLTFHRDILPIFQQNCQACHQAGAMSQAPTVKIIRS